MSYDSIPRKGLVGEWLLDGDALDTSGEGNDGTETDVSYVDSEVGFQKKCGSFNGSSSVLELPVSTMGTIGTGDFYVSGWYYLVDPGSGNYPLLFGSFENTNGHFYGPTLFFDPYNEEGGGDKIEFRIDAGNKLYSNISASSLYNGRHHIIIQRVGTNLQLWIDGKIDNNITDSLNIPNADACWICRGFSPQRRHGKTALVRASGTKSLIEQEIQSLYLEGKRKLGQNNYPDLFKGCVAYYDMNGDASDIVGGNNGTVNGATLTTDRFGIANRAYNFDGSNDYISIPNLLTFQSEVKELSFYTTIKRDVIGGIRSIFQARLQSGNNQGLDIFFRDDNKIQIRITSDSGIQGHADTINSYTSNSNYLKIILIRNSARGYSLYINGVKQTLENGTNASLSDSNTIITSTNTFSGMTDVIDIGAFGSWGNCCYFDGKIENTIIRDRALSDVEVKQIHTLQNTKYPLPRTKSSVPSLSDGLVLNIDGTHDGNTYFDQSGNGNNGTGTDVVDGGRIGEHKVMEFNGSSSYMQTNTAVNTNADFSMSVWFKPNVGLGNKVSIIFDLGESGGGGVCSISRDDTVTNRRASFGLYVANNRQFVDNSSFTPEINKWYYFVGVRKKSNNTISLYINGKLIGSRSISSDSCSSGIKTTTGCSTYAITYSHDHYLDGNIINPKIHNRALTEKEIQQEYYRNFIPF